MQHANGFLKVVEDSMPFIQEVDAHQTKAKQDKQEDFILIDVREDHEWEQGHIPQAIHLGRGIIERDIEQLIPDKSQCLILYCGGGYRSALAAHNLQKMGYTNVYSMSGGIKSWQSAGYTIMSAD